MRKVLSIILAISMIFSLTTTASAEDASTTPTDTTEVIEEVVETEETMPTTEETVAEEEPTEEETEPTIEETDPEETESVPEETELVAEETIPVEEIEEVVAIAEEDTEPITLESFLAQPARKDFCMNLMVMDRTLMVTESYLVQLRIFQD